jgi:hypothetical protein
VIAASLESGREIPEHLISPDVLPEVANLIEAFDEISTCRPSGFGFAPIPFSAIDQWATRHGWDDIDDFDFLRRAIRVCDIVTFEHLEKTKTEKT